MIRILIKVCLIKVFLLKDFLLKVLRAALFGLGIAK